MKNFSRIENQSKNLTKMEYTRNDNDKQMVRLIVLENFITILLNEDYEMLTYKGIENYLTIPDDKLTLFKEYEREMINEIRGMVIGIKDKKEIKDK